MQLMIRYYECQRCTRVHFQDEGRYVPHLTRQSKDGVRYMTISQATRMLRIAREAEDKDTELI